MNEETKPHILANKARIQAAFSQELRLNVDIPLGTYGNTNDGNTARKFFLNHEKSAEITGVDVRIIRNLKYILLALNSGLAINVEELNNICRETGQLYIELYDWYKMPASLHKILIHGPMVVDQFLLPIGNYSEEAQEARTSDLRSFKRDYSRKGSRIENLEDVFNRLTLTSDPYLVKLTGGNIKCKIIYDRELLKLLNITEDCPYDINIISQEDYDDLY